MPSDYKLITSQANQNDENKPDAYTTLKGQERRQYVRRSARWHVTVNTRDKYVIESMTLDISERGASISSPVDIKIGEPILLNIHTFYKGKKVSYKVIGEVKRSSIAKADFTLGIFFKSASEDAFNFFRFYAEGRI